jgi:hypothetical protein
VTREVGGSDGDILHPKLLLAAVAHAANSKHAAAARLSDLR